MTTERIYHLLHGVQKNKSDGKSAFQYLDKDYVKIVTENLTLLISDQDKIHYTLQLQLFIREFCKRTKKHLNLNAENFIEFLNSGLWNEETDVCEELKEVRNKSEEIIRFYFDQMLKLQNKQQNMDYVMAFTINNFKEFDYTQPKKLENCMENYQLILSLLDENNVVRQTKKENDYLSYKESQRREAVIKLGYAILILNSSKGDAIISNVLLNLATRTPLKQCERNFIKYVFANHDIYQMEIMNKFPFVLEIPMIQLCTDAMENNVTKFSLSDDGIQHLNKFVLAKKRFKFTILEIAYELFALSGYNDYIFKLIAFIEQHL